MVYDIIPYSSETNSMQKKINIDEHKLSLSAATRCIKKTDGNACISNLLHYRLFLLLIFERAMMYRLKS